LFGPILNGVRYSPRPTSTRVIDAINATGLRVCLPLTARPAQPHRAGRRFRGTDRAARVGNFYVKPQPDCRPVWVGQCSPVRAAEGLSGTGGGRARRARTKPHPLRHRPKRRLRTTRHHRHRAGNAVICFGAWRGGPDLSSVLRTASPPGPSGRHWYGPWVPGDIALARIRGWDGRSSPPGPG